ncbi:hypothetical protein FX988_00886 [Paraglaciecola mesophila]|uniref:Winged helix-turn-helix domain-containing protein n=1 Tax=Paraglaciecola mesophila TaxID=197222 RepID=A0A857JG75_9ALTE|nr:crosslink repair DNA glycosylase YcaQ family protein [Paraglaciecola mesophila]QHJ10666.1 hypothetical protein FX988_00886 [Paraglaciecola mesophila]
MPESISPEQARKLVLHAQGLAATKKRGKALTHTRDALESLGYVQIDTISAIERAHHHTLWNRNPDYHPSHLTQLVAQKHAFEYWTHAAAYLPMKDYRYSLPRKAALASGELDHWYPRNAKLMQEVLSRISSEGPLMAKDFETPSSHAKRKPKDWASKPAKQALEYLFMQGELMIKERVNFHKVYELTERVLPTSVDRSFPTEQENWHFLICRFLRANGLGQASEIAYLRKHTKAGVQQTISNMLEAGELVNIQVAGTTYVTLPQLLETLNRPVRRSKLHILSPFDNLLIQRKRMQNLFNFDYLLECYVPASKRQYGYFSLPILWDANLVARMDCKVDRKTKVLHIQHLALEPNVRKVDAFQHALKNALPGFLTFNQCQAYTLHKTSQAL